MKTLGSYFSEKIQNWKSVFGLRRRGRIAYEPIPWNAQGDPKIEEKKEHISEALFLNKKCKKYEKWAPKVLQKGEEISRVAPLGAVLGHVWCPKPFSDPKNEPIAPPKCLQGPKTTQKMTPEVEKILEKCSKKGQHSVLFFKTFLLRKWEAQYRILGLGFRV